MDRSGAKSGRMGWVAAFVGLAMLSGPIRTLTSVPFYFGLPWPTPWSSAIASGIAGIVLLGWCVAKGWPLVDAREWVILVVLLLPQWMAEASPVLRLHETSWGVVSLLGLAAPLWLALLSALQLIPVDVPRATAGAAIAGVGAMCLMTPAGAYSVAPNQVPMLGVHLLISIATVYTWTYAARRLANAGALASAGGFLLLGAVSQCAVLRVFGAGPQRPFDWHSGWLSLLLQAAVAGCSYCLWFWLLRRMQLAAFCMSALASWTASLLPGFAMFAFVQWRVDVATAIAVAAIVMGLRARVADEQPTALGLRET